MCYNKDKKEKKGSINYGNVERKPENRRTFDRQ